MFWLLPVMVLDVVDEAVMNAKVVRTLPVYSSIMTIHEHYIDCLDNCIRYVVRDEGIQIRMYEDFLVVSGQDDYIRLAHTATWCLAVHTCHCDIRPCHLC